MFTDYTKIFEVIKDMDSDRCGLQVDLTRMQEWARKMQMIFHPQKCKCMHLGNNNPGSQYTMSTSEGQHTLEAVDEQKDLGVIIDRKLTFSSHIHTQINKANRILGAIRHTFADMDSDIFT